MNEKTTICFVLTGVKYSQSDLGKHYKTFCGLYLDDMKFKLGKARYKDAVTPAEVHKVDSAIVHMGQQIAEDFKKIMKR